MIRKRKNESMAWSGTCGGPLPVVFVNLNADPAMAPSVISLRFTFISLPQETNQASSCLLTLLLTTHNHGLSVLLVLTVLTTLSKSRSHAHWTPIHPRYPTPNGQCTHLGIAHLLESPYVFHMQCTATSISWPRSPRSRDNGTSIPRCMMGCLFQVIPALPLRIASYRPARRQKKVRLTGLGVTQSLIRIARGLEI